MRILFVIRTLNPAWGGPVEGFKNISTQALRHGFSPEVVCVDDPASAWLAQIQIPVHAVGKGFATFGYNRNLDRWLAENLERFDAVVVHSVWMYFSYAVWKATRKRDVPYYLFIHGALDPWFRKYYPLKHLKKILYWKLIEHKVVRDAKAVLFTTEEEKQLAHNAFQPYACNPVVVGYGIASPPMSFDSDEASTIRNLTAKFPGLQNRKYLLFLGRIHEKKGIDLLLEAFARAGEAYHGIALMLAGPGEASQVERFKKLAAGLKLDGRAVWTGPLYKTEKWAAMRAAEAFILPSHQENFGIGVVESLACGTPVLISNKVNIWREVRREESGLVDSDDLEGTVRLLQNWASTDAARRFEMRANARRCFLKHFDTESNSRQLFDLLRIGCVPAIGNPTSAAS